MNVYFDHEKLNVYKKSLNWVSMVTEILPKIPKDLSVRDQLDRASTSIVLNIAEGNGKQYPKDRIRHLTIARSSALECAACLDILFYKNLISESDAENGKLILKDIFAMLMGWQKYIHNNSDKLREPEESYGDDDINMNF